MVKFTLGMWLLLLKGANLVLAAGQKQQYATRVNFVTQDLLDGDDGLPPHPLAPLKYGKPAVRVTVAGAALEEVEGHITYYEGMYWLHSATWGCGHFAFQTGSSDPTFPAMQAATPGADYGADGPCGIKTYSSPDLTNWTLEDFYQATNNQTITKPVVRYSNATGLYVMFMGNEQLVNFPIMTAPHPAGPWGPNPPNNLTGATIGHDFDIAVAPDGTHYMLTDVRPAGSGTFTGVWSLHVQALAPNLTSLASTNATLIRSADQLIAQNLTLEACGFFYHDGYYYMTFGETKFNALGYIYYLYSTNPLGPYTDGGYLTLDGCGGQNKAAFVLPSANGPAVVAGNLGYRTSPTDLVVGRTLHGGDNSQAASSTYLFPLEFNANHTIKPFTCPAVVQIPLAGNITQTPESAQPTELQLDCRVRSWKTIQQVYKKPLNGSTLSFPVWQRTDNLGPTANAARVMDGPLYVSLDFTSGPTQTFTFQVSNISWAPDVISMDVKGKSVTKITLSTNATVGCYGTIVQRKRQEGSYTMYQSDGLTTSTGYGIVHTASDGELYVYQP